MGLVVYKQEPKEHNDGGSESKQECLIGLQDMILMPVEADQSPGTNGRDLPEEIQEDQIRRENQPDHRADEKEEHQIIFTLVVFAADITDGIDEDKSADGGGDDGHEYRKGIHGKDEIHTQDERPIYRSRFALHRK